MLVLILVIMIINKTYVLTIIFIVALKILHTIVDLFILKERRLSTMFSLLIV